MATTKTYKATNGGVKVQIEDLLGKNPSGGWKYQAPGQGNKGAEGAHYYYKSQTAEGSLKSAPSYGRFGFNVEIKEAGTYSILLRASRDTNKPGDARNDIWIRVDGDTQDVMPKGTKQLTDGGQGFVKFKGAQAGKWLDAKTFSTPAHGDKNPLSDVVFKAGTHKIEFAPRSTGYHIDSVKVIKKGATITSNTSSSSAATEAPDKEPAVETKPGTGGSNAGTDRIAIAAKHDDFESNKAGASGDLEFGRDGDGAQSVGLRFKGLDLDKGTDIKAAYFVFEAAETSKGKANFEIEIENSRNAKTYSRTNDPDDRKYLAQDVDWNVESWKKGATYKSADIADLIEEVIAGGDADALAFRVSGSGQRVAHAFEGQGDAPELVIVYDHG